MRSRRRARPLTRDQAMDLALGLIAARSRSRAEVHDALVARGRSPATPARVLGRLRRFGYIDDEKFAAECAERLRERGYGSLRITDQLRRLAVDERIVDGVLPAPAEERALARRALERRFDERDLGDRRGLARAARFLAGRGFPAEVIDSLFDVWE